MDSAYCHSYLMIMAHRQILPNETANNAVLEAITELGSQGRLAAVCGCTPGNIWQLVKRRRPLPAEYVLRVEAATSVTRYDLRPDLYPRESNK